MQLRGWLKVVGAWGAKQQDAVISLGLAVQDVVLCLGLERGVRTPSNTMPY